MMHSNNGKSGENTGKKMAQSENIQEINSMFLVRIFSEGDETFNQTFQQDFHQNIGMYIKLPWMTVPQSTTYVKGGTTIFTILLVISTHLSGIW